MLRRVESALDALGACATVLLCILIVLTVFFREMLGFGLPDGIILVRELMVPAILFPLAVATSRRAHVSIEVIANHFPDTLNRWIAVLAALVGLTIVIAFAVGGWQQFARTLENGAHYGGDLFIPKWISRAAFVLAFFVVTLRMVQILWVDLIAAIRGRSGPATP